jgi:hypothetical protein
MSEAEREWFPCDWVDEFCPPSRSAPDGFIVPVPGGFELGYTDPDESELHNEPLKIGDVIEFISCERLPEIEATLRADGSFELHGAIPTDHNTVTVDGEVDTQHETFDELIKDIRAPEGDWRDVRSMVFRDGETEKRVTLYFANWSDPQPFLFEIVEGRPTFGAVPAQKQ